MNFNMNLLETYLRELNQTHSTGLAVKETSYYGALANLLNGVGATLKPRVRCVVHVQNQGAGIPDGGLFTSDQKVDDPAQMAGMLPSRGVIEVKGTKEDVLTVAAGLQVAKYWQKYRQVLVTNYRDFALVGQDAQGQAAVLEMYRLAPDEAAFWKGTAQPAETVNAHGERFIEYLKRVLLHAAPLTLPADVAWHLASYARDARVRIEHAELPALASVRRALEEALGLTFEGVKGDHFFRSTLIQTLFYGVFSAWVLWSKRNPPNSAARFDWKTAAWELHVPMIRALFEQVASPSKLGPLGLVEPLDWTAAALNRVDRTEFFARFEEEHAVQYFYEPFLQAFDPELRRELGVWYTPPEVVEYMVARVDTVLREELGLKAGLADPNVYVLDPCCGTGAFLVAVLKRIAQTLTAQDDSGLVAHDVKQAAMERVFGFEILPAPFVVAHWQLGLYLQHLGAPLVQKVDERVGVYLTNALTGWETNATARKHPAFPEMDDEREAADHVKRDKRILVILGNPPYNGYAGVSPKEEQGLLEPYKKGLKDWGITKNYLDDLYVRFFRIAERRIAETSGQGIVCYISNFSYLSDPSFVVMRQSLLRGFDKFWFDCMNGDSRQTGKLTPEGKPDPSIFSTEYNREGIRVGTTIGLMVRKETRDKHSVVRFRQWWGAKKRAELLASVQQQNISSEYQSAEPTQANRFSFRPSNVSQNYSDWPSLVDIAAVKPSLGLNDNRGQAVHDVSQDVIASRMTAYYDPAVPHDSITALHSGLTTNAASFDALATRAKLQKTSKYDKSSIRRFWFKPFDLRWAYVERNGNLWNRIRPELINQAWEGNEFLLARCHAPKHADGATLFYSRHLSDQHAMHTDAYFFPVRLAKAKAKEEPQAALFEGGEAVGSTTANLSASARAYLTKLGVTNPDAEAETAGLIWMHALAVGYAPAYLAENADGLKQDWPRVCLPDSLALLRASAELGRQVAALLDVESPVEGVTSGTIRPELRAIGVIARDDGGSLNPDPDAGDFALTAGWGHAGSGGVTMPARGKTVPRDVTPDERAALQNLAVSRHADSSDAAFLPAVSPDAPIGLTLLGATTRDVYLNADVYWRNVPEPVWNYTIGGYQVIKKWLSYRELALLGRPLTHHEARYVTQMIRRITALLLLAPGLDANYNAIKAAALPLA